MSDTHKKLQHWNDHITT